MKWLYIHVQKKGRGLLIEAGAAWEDTVAGAVKDAELIFTMVGYPVDVEEIYFWRWWYFFNW